MNNVGCYITRGVQGARAIGMRTTGSRPGKDLGAAQALVARRGPLQHTAARLEDRQQGRCPSLVSGQDKVSAKLCYRAR